MELSGIAHIQLTVNDIQRAIPFYEEVLSFMGMTTVVKAPNGLYMIGGKTAVAIARSSAENRTVDFDQRRIGLHHVCFRARSRADIDSLYDFLRQNGAHIVHPPENGTWAPGYYSILFEDPDGIRLEVNFVPGKGHLQHPEKLPLESLPGYDDYPD